MLCVSLSPNATEEMLIGLFGEHGDVVAFQFFK